VPSVDDEASDAGSQRHVRGDSDSPLDSDSTENSEVTDGGRVNVAATAGAEPIVAVAAAADGCSAGALGKAGVDTVADLGGDGGVSECGYGWIAVDLEMTPTQFAALGDETRVRCVASSQVQQLPQQDMNLTEAHRTHPAAETAASTSREPSPQEGSMACASTLQT
jgi:hypothetical protein